MSRRGYLVSYPADFGPAMLAEGFIQRVKFRLEHDKLRLSNFSLRKMFGKMCPDEKTRALQMLKADPLLKFAYLTLRTKAKIKKEITWSDSAYVEALVDKVAGIPYGVQTFLSISLIKSKADADDLMLSLRVFRGIEGKAYATRFGCVVPANIAVDMRNALDRLINRHKGKLIAGRDVSTNKYSTDAHSAKRKSGKTKHSEDDQTTQYTTED